MKNHLKLILFILLLIGKSSFAQSLLWEIKDPKGNHQQSYLFGSIHIQDQRVFDFDSTVFYKINNCTHFANELDFDSINNPSFGMMMMNDRSITTILDSNALHLLKKKCEQSGLPFMAMQYLKPFYIYQTLMMMDMPKDKTMSLDQFLYHYAQTQNKEALGLEYFQDQFSIMNQLSEANGDDILIQYLNDTNQAKSNKEYETMIQLYLSQDIAALYSYTAASNDFEALTSTLTERNKNMLNSILLHTKVNTLFSVVGAAHLGGENGLIQLLRNEGFEVTPVALKFIH